MKVNIVLYNNDGWILTDIANALNNSLISIGINCHISSTPLEYYDVYHHFIYTNLQKKNIVEGAINTVFVTHIDSIIKWKKILHLDSYINGFICMSNFDKKRITKFGIAKEKVFVCEPYSRIVENEPRHVSLGIFTNVYADGRKNEELMVNSILKLKEYNKVLKVYIIGEGWEKHIQHLRNNDFFVQHSKFDVSIYLDYLEKIDILLYSGFDGGAISEIDAIAKGINCIIPYDGFMCEFKTPVFYRSKLKAEKVICQAIFKFINDAIEINHRTIEKYSLKHLDFWNELTKIKHKGNLIPYIINKLITSLFILKIFKK